MNIYLKAFVLIKCGEKCKYLNYIKPHINSVRLTLSSNSSLIKGDK